MYCGCVKVLSIVGKFCTSMSGYCVLFDPSLSPIILDYVLYTQEHGESSLKYFSCRQTVTFTPLSISRHYFLLCFFRPFSTDIYPPPPHPLDPYTSGKKMRLLNPPTQILMFEFRKRYGKVDLRCVPHRSPNCFHFGSPFFQY